ncbi:DUF948 domain-containing protein [Neobacillus piezotolerans]|uniref:DUF948 domain-containing protein n=1 Tax=Neobacillus piezotolerans TaxID=2259171 RepID=A0A3D8GWI2_9BACI|nr:DUF948 domain-containing protein [Neobacillus piezotolerans]RDU38817.1 DUF948 domain-containing protein [Neobacillus piezotolerans]
MWIVYLSIAAVILSLAYLGFAAFKTFKEAKPAINRLNETVARVQQKADTLKVESDQLAKSQQELIADIDYKKEAVTFTADAAKDTLSTFKKLVKIRPSIKLKGKKKTRTPAY